MTADEIKQCVARRYAKKLWFVNFEVGLCKGGKYRADIVASNMGSTINVIEVKSSVADYRSDKKWHQYAPFCDRFFFAMHSAVYAKLKAELPKGVAVFVVSDSGKVMLKGRTRNNVVDPAVRLNIITRLAYRSADFTLYQRKSKIAGPMLVAGAALDAIRKVPKVNRKMRKGKYLQEQVAEAIKKFV